jgi:hypothetical protein
MSDLGLAFQQRRRSATTQRDASLAQNAYSRMLGQQRGSRNLADIDRNMTRGLESLASGHARRGLRHSGIFQTAQNDYGSAWMQQRQDVNDEIASTLRQADFADSQAWNAYQATEADIEAEKQAQIMSTAALLEQFKPFLGS